VNQFGGRAAMVTVLVMGMAWGLWTDATQARAGSVPADQLARAIKAGRQIDENRITVIGTLNLRSVKEVTAPIRCRDCIFHGGIVAPSVTFRRIVVLSGSQFHGRLDFGEARFDQGLFVRPTERPAEVSGRT
jgi:hypothetical protein